MNRAWAVRKLREIAHDIEAYKNKRKWATGWDEYTNSRYFGLHELLLKIEARENESRLLGQKLGDSRASGGTDAADQGRQRIEHSDLLLGDGDKSG